MRLSVNGVTLIDEWTLLFSRKHSWVKPTKTAKITKPIHRTRKFHRKNRSSITFFGITVVSMRFRNLPTDGSTSSGLMMISSSLKVILKLEELKTFKNILITSRYIFYLNVCSLDVTGNGKASGWWLNGNKRLQHSPTTKRNTIGAAGKVALNNNNKCKKIRATAVSKLGGINLAPEFESDLSGISSV